MNLKQVDEGSADERQKLIIQNAIKKMEVYRICMQTW